MVFLAVFLPTTTFSVNQCFLWFYHRRSVHLVVGGAVPCADCSAPSVPAVSSASACRIWWCARAVTSTTSTVSGAWRAAASWFQATSSRSAMTDCCVVSTMISPSTSSYSVWVAPAAAVRPSRASHLVRRIASTARTSDSLLQPATTTITTTTMKRRQTISQVQYIDRYITGIRGAGIVIAHRPRRTLSVFFTKKKQNTALCTAVHRSTRLSTLCGVVNIPTLRLSNTNCWWWVKTIAAYRR